MKQSEIKAFVRKYNSEFAIKGYSKMKKQPLTDEVKSVISKSRAEIQKEWRELNKGSQIQETSQKVQGNQEKARAGQSQPESRRRLPQPAQSG